MRSHYLRQGGALETQNELSGTGDTTQVTRSKLWGARSRHEHTHGFRAATPSQPPLAEARDDASPEGVV